MNIDEMEIEDLLDEKYIQSLGIKISLLEIQNKYKDLMLQLIELEYRLYI
jgi:hypothetical protein